LAEYEGNANLAEVLDDLRTLPFLAPRRVVVLRDADSFISANRSHLEDYLAEPCPTGTLVLMPKTFPSNTRLYKRVAEIGRCIACQPPKAFALPKWLVERARDAYNKRLDNEAARQIVDNAGNNLGLLDGELAKLALYVGTRPTITVDDVAALVGHHREEKVFGLLNAMADGDIKTAMQLWEDVWQTDRAAPHRAIGGIAFGVRRMLEAHVELHSGKHADYVARRLFTDPARLRQRLQVFTPQRLTRQLRDLSDADVASKTGGVSVRTSIERFILEHSAAS
jgi:DNA polymerase-3 subunit delta